MADISNPHDTFFKELFSRPEAARDFVAHHLPPEIASLIELDSLAQEQGSFVDEDLQAHYADVLYQARLTNGGPCQIYLLFEHKSRAEKMTPLQLLRYKVNIWTEEIKRTPSLTKLTPIVPIVFYHGPGGWQVARNFADLVDIRPGAEALREYVPQFKYHLFEARLYDEATSRDAALLRIGLATLKYIFRSNIGAQLAEFFTIFQDMEENAAAAYVDIVLHYVTSYSPRVKETEVQAALENAFPRLKDKAMMSMVERWQQKGLQKGLQQGLQKGLMEGQRQEASALVLRLLDKRFAPVPVRLRGQIAKLPVVTLEELAEAIVDFQNSKDVAAWVRQKKANNEPSA